MVEMDRFDICHAITAKWEGGLVSLFIPIERPRGGAIEHGGAG